MLIRLLQISFFFTRLLLPCLPCMAFGQVDENTMKAIAFEKISQFVEWPAESRKTEASTQFVFGVMGDNKVVSRVRELYTQHKIKNKIVEIRYISKLDDVIDCHLIYIAYSEKDDLSEVVAITAGKPVLTAADSPGFAEEGVLLNLNIKQDKLRFEINEKSFRESGLRIDPILLRVAKIVNPIKNKG